jgi:hypothetical protein
MAEHGATGGAVLRVLIESRPHDPDVWVAECLETGFVATGLGYNEAREGILEILRTETKYAHENGRTLTGRMPVPTVLEERWETVTRDHPAQTIPLFPAGKKPAGRVTDRQVAVARAVR